MVDFNRVAIFCNDFRLKSITSTTLKKLCHYFGTVRGALCEKSYHFQVHFFIIEKDAIIIANLDLGLEALECLRIRRCENGHEKKTECCPHFRLLTLYIGRSDLNLIRFQSRTDSETRGTGVFMQILPFITCSKNKF
jgi:hypothetical protein